MNLPPAVLWFKTKMKPRDKSRRKRRHHLLLRVRLSRMKTHTSWHQLHCFQRRPWSQTKCSQKSLLNTSKKKTPLQLVTLNRSFKNWLRWALQVMTLAKLLSPPMVTSKLL